ncbi:MAG TPA: hypothetical protein VKT30_15940 [Caulobacteraceae bacterium]|nr:hypothetical protein [Caulobacteraceae bacterium]
MHLLAIKAVIHLVAVYATPLCGGIALIKGGKPERLGAAVFVAAILLTDLFFALASPAAHPRPASTAIAAISSPTGYANTTSTAYIDLASTLLLSCFFLYLAIRYASLWLAAAMIIQASELYFARLYIDSDFANFNVYAIELNSICALVLFTLAGAALWSWRSRTVKRRDDAKRALAAERRREEQERRFQAMFDFRTPSLMPASVAPGKVARLIIEPPPI